jgi:hypothetical protein
MLRQPIYEQDRMLPVTPGTTPGLDAETLAKLPEGYRYLAYLQLGLGMKVKLDMPQLTGSAVEELYRTGARWLEGEAAA